MGIHERLRGVPAMQNLEQNWTALWKRLGVQGDANAVYDDLVARYLEP